MITQKEAPAVTEAQDLNTVSNYTADRDQIAKFFDALFIHSLNGFVNLRGFDASNKPAGHWRAVPVENANAVIDTAAKLATQLANWKPAAVFCPPVATFKTANGAKEKDLCEGVALSVDIDEGNTQALAQKLIGVIGRPTAVVHSGGEVADPGTGEVLPKLHIHWRLSEPTTEEAEHRLLKEARTLATAIIGADATNVPAVHPLRWPGSWHTKGQPKPCTIAELDEDAEIHLSDALEVLRLAAAALPDKVVQLKPEGVKNDPTDYIQCVDNIRSGVDLHHSMVRLSAKRAHAGMNEHAIVEELQSLMDLSEAPRDERWQMRYNDIARTVRSAMQFRTETISDHAISELFTNLAETEPDDGWLIMPYRVDGDPDLSQDQLALELSAAGFKKDTRFVSQWGKWLLWDGQRWVKDDKLQHMTAVRDFVRAKAGQLIEWGKKKAAEADNEKDAKQVLKFTRDNAKAMRQAGSVQAVESLARSNADLIASVDQFDADLMLLGTPHGTVNLKSGELIKAERNHWITKLCAVAPAEHGTDAPIWTAFLNRIFDGNQSLIQFMQRAAGYALTGYTTEHKLLFLFGTGSNGKSVFLNTIFNIMGDYSKRAAAQTFLNSSGDKHPTDLAGLHGARLVAGSELPAGKAWNESVVKDLTGGDIITARFMRQDFFDYMPQFTLFIAGNHRPSFSGIDESIRRRVCLVPFTQTIPAEERDPDLPEKLESEWPAILRWMIDGALEWQRIGLAVPDEVSAASAEYMEDEDTMTEFFDENLVKVPFSSVSVADMYERFSTWQRVSGVGRVWTKKAMSNAFAESGMKAEKGTGGARLYKGYSLKPEPAHYRAVNSYFTAD